MSLRARILALGVGAAVAVLVLLAVPATLSVHSAAQQEAEQRASTLVQGLADYLSTGSASTADLSAVVDRLDGRGRDFPVAVVLADGTRIGSSIPSCGDSASAPGSSGGSGRGRDGRGDRRDDGELLPTSPITTDGVDGGELVSISSVQADGDATICAFISSGDVWGETADQAAPLGAVGLGIVAVVAVVALLIARRLARDLTAMAHTADRLSEGDFDARVPGSGPPEVRRVGWALNRLADRIDELITIERETVADLSHRLRTPMTAVRLDVEALPDSAEKAELEDHYAQLERTLTAVIQAARRPQREGVLPSADLAEVVRDRFDYWSPLLEDQGRDVSLSVDVAPATLVRAAREDLAAALDALLENSIAHTPDATPVRVEVTSRDDARAQVDVLDQGPGVPPQALQRGLSDRGSSGLGLDIARACAEASGGHLELGVREPWQLVRLVLGG